MSLSTLSSAQLAQLIGLVKKRGVLQAKLDKVDAALNALESGSSVPKRRGRKPGRPALPKLALKGRKVRKRSKRLKESILKLLKSAGSSGITVKELSAKLKVKPGNIFSWFYTTGKKVSGLKKVGEAKYALS
ncbi:MAG: hypothetical protein LV481_11970 [Methylacidiphilales bacterium]|nr:hypothetical protein [Candidatus Methylacidiphilales bacterium]